VEQPVRKHIRLQEYDYNQPGYYFITICTHNRQPLFWQGPNQLSSLGKLAWTCLEELPAHISGLELDVHCVMHDHIHAILIVESVGPPYMAADRSKQTISRAVQQYKAAVTRCSGQKGIWQSGFYDHIIRNDDDLDQIRQYIQNNPLKRNLEQGGWAAEGGGPYDPNG
jgi:REP element-mobilizing transposase RayT